jgi:hypothetical protein
VNESLCSQAVDEFQASEAAGGCCPKSQGDNDGVGGDAPRKASTDTSTTAGRKLLPSVLKEPQEELEDQLLEYHAW